MPTWFVLCMEPLQCFSDNAHPDGFLDGRTMVATAALSAGGLALALRQLKRQLPRRRVPLMGLAAAFVFAAQILQFSDCRRHFRPSSRLRPDRGPARAGRCGSGPYGGPDCSVPCVRRRRPAGAGREHFQHGHCGRGRRLCNFRCVQRLARGPRGVIMGAAFAAWCSAVIAAVLVAGELAISGTAQWAIVFPRWSTCIC